MHYSTACTIIFNYFGEDAQKRKLQEECAELIRAIARNDNENIIEEMADVLLLIEQFQTVPQYFLKIEDIMQQKAERTLERINKENTPCLAADCLGCTCTDEECRMKR